MKNIVPQKARDWYALQSQRDRRALVFLVCIAFISGVYMGFKPLHKFRNKAGEEYHKAAGDLAVLKKFSPSTSQGSAGSLKTTIETTAQKNNLTLDTVEVVEGGIKVSGGKIAFNQFLLWLDELYMQNSILATKLSITRHLDTGYVSVSVTFVALGG